MANALGTGVSGKPFEGWAYMPKGKGKEAYRANRNQPSGANLVPEGYKTFRGYWTPPNLYTTWYPTRREISLRSTQAGGNRIRCSKTVMPNTTATERNAEFSVGAR